MDNDLIIVITGESGSGKSWIIRELLSKYPNIDIMKKYTTRNSRVDEDGTNIETQGNMSFEEVSKMEYTYVNSMNKELYGFKAADINNSLISGKIPCLGISDEKMYIKLSNDFPDMKLLLLKVVPYYDYDTMKESWEKQGRTLEEFEQRKGVLENPLTDWVYEDKYDHVRREVVNPYFLRSCSPEISKGVILKRIEYVLHGELGACLGATFVDKSHSTQGLYDYLYIYSKNRPRDEKLTFESRHHKL